MQTTTKVPARQHFAAALLAEIPDGIERVINFSDFSRRIGLNNTTVSRLLTELRIARIVRTSPVKDRGLRVLIQKRGRLADLAGEVSGGSGGAVAMVGGTKR